jgi:hypothetical protein
MRAFDLMVFMVCLNLAIGLVATVLQTEGQKSYYQANEGNGWTYNITDHSEMAATGQNATPVEGTFELTKWMIGGMLFFVSMLSSIVWMVPALEHTFMIPPAISIILQTLVWIIYAAGLIQWFSNRPLKAFD